MLFDDVPDDLDLGPDAPDRALFASIASRGAVGELPVDEAWGILADRYANDLRLRVLAIAREIEAHGTAEGRTADEYLGALAGLRGRAGAGDVEVLDALEVFLKDALGRAPDEAFRRARRTLRKLEQAVLEEAAERTVGGRPFGERVAAAKGGGIDDDAALLARAQGEIRPYAPKSTFASGDRVSHAKFGVGVVIARAEGKIEVVFPEGRKKLVSA
jgi:hypothetical protein